MKIQVLQSLLDVLIYKNKTLRHALQTIPQVKNINAMKTILAYAIIIVVVFILFIFIWVLFNLLIVTGRSDDEYPKYILWLKDHFLPKHDFLRFIIFSVISLISVWGVGKLAAYIGKIFNIY